MKKDCKISMEEYPTSDGACGDNAEASRRPDLVEVLTQPMSPKKDDNISKS